VDLEARPVVYILVTVSCLFFSEESPVCLSAWQSESSNLETCAPHKPGWEMASM